MKNWLPYIMLVIGILGCCAVSYLIGYDRGFDEAPVTVKRDTVWRDTTIFVDRPVEVEKWKTKEKLVYVPITDTIHHHDTTYSVLPREYKRYEDESYEALVSGIDPLLEWIKVNQKTAYITETKTIRKRWGFSATLGPSVLYNGDWHAGLGATVGFSYNF